MAGRVETYFRDTEAGLASFGIRRDTSMWESVRLLPWIAVDFVLGLAGGFEGGVALLHLLQVPDITTAQQTGQFLIALGIGVMTGSIGTTIPFALRGRNIRKTDSTRYWRLTRR